MTAWLPPSVAGQLAHQIQRGDHRGPARLAGEDPLLAGDPAGHRECVTIRHPNPAIHRRGVERAGEEILADALGEVRAGGVAGQHRALGIGADHDEVGLLRAEEVHRSRDRAARADACDEVRQATIGLLPDLGSRRPLVGARVLHVPVLVRLEGPGDVPREPGSDGVVALRRFGRHVGRAQHDLGAVRPEQGLLLGGLLVGHHEDAAVALPRGRDRQPVAGVAGRRLDDRAARFEQPGLFGCLDHREPDAVLDGAARIEHLELGEDERETVRGTEPAQQTVDPDERRLPDEVEDRLGVLHRPEYTEGLRRARALRRAARGRPPRPPPGWPARR